MTTLLLTPGISSQLALIDMIDVDNGFDDDIHDNIDRKKKVTNWRSTNCTSTQGFHNEIK